MNTRHVSIDTPRPLIDTLKEQLQRVGVATFTAPNYRNTSVSGSAQRLCSGTQALYPLDRSRCTIQRGRCRSGIRVRVRAALRLGGRPELLRRRAGSRRSGFLRRPASRVQANDRPVAGPARRTGVRLHGWRRYSGFKSRSGLTGRSGAIVDREGFLTSLQEARRQSRYRYGSDLRGVKSWRLALRS